MGDSVIGKVYGDLVLFTLKQQAKDADRWRKLMALDTIVRIESVGDRFAPNELEQFIDSLEDDAAMMAKGE